MFDSRRKGGKFELRMSKLLNAWHAAKCPDQTLKKPFARRSTALLVTPGHWIGTGDILWKDGLKWPWCIECKSVEGWVLDDLFKEHWEVWKWWEQACKQAMQFNRELSSAAALEPMLFFNRHHHHALGMAHQDSLKSRVALSDLDHLVYGDLVIFDPTGLDQLEWPTP